jgi:hypothetical protein
MTNSATAKEIQQEHIVKQILEMKISINEIINQ